MLFSRVNLAVVDVASKDKADPTLNRVHLEADGTSVASDGRAVLAVAPVSPKRAALFPAVEREEAEPGPGGVGASLSTVRDAMKVMPRDKQHPSLEHVQMTRRDARELELMATDGVRKRKVSGLPMRGGFLPWRRMLREARDGEPAVRVCVDREALVKMLRAMPADPGNRNPVFLELREGGRPLVARCVSPVTGQRVMGMVQPLGTGGDWLGEDEWETGLRSGGNEEAGPTIRRVRRVKE